MAHKKEAHNQDEDVKVNESDLTLEGRIANDEQAENNLEAEPQAPAVPDFNETDGVNPVGSPHESQRPVDDDVRNPQTIADGDQSENDN